MQKYRKFWLMVRASGCTVYERRSVSMLVAGPCRTQRIKEYKAFGTCFSASSVVNDPSTIHSSFGLSAMAIRKQQCSQTVYECCFNILNGSGKDTFWLIVAFWSQKVDIIYVRYNSLLDITLAWQVVNINCFKNIKVCVVKFCHIKR